MAFDSYIGRSDAKIDKGCRIYIPSPFRKVMGEETTFVARIDMDERYLVVYSQRAWDKMVADLMARANDWDTEDQKLILQVNDEAIYLQIDDQGRFKLPKQLADYLEFNSDVTFAGMIDRFAIWGKERYDEHRASRPSLKDAMEAFNKRHNPNS